ncbi:MAG TPA: HAMP domain-containing sensor histidine kinase, partial [Microlunatus sp.]|nr:HAMP domain-containing sensor histidine kinase [Microlunatus sp.]
MTDFVIIIGLTLGACLVVGLLGAAAMHGLRGRSLRYQLIIATLLPVAAVTATVIVNVWLMFLSPHDSTVIMIALIVAVLVAAFGNIVVMRRVGRGSAELGVVLRRMRADSTGAPSGGTPSSGAVEAAPSQLPAELALVVADLEETQRLLTETRRREQAAEDARRELVRFMSHDLRTPLAGLRALTEGLEDGVVHDVPRALEHMRATINRMTHLVEDLFELSRVQGARPARPSSLVSLTELIVDVSSESSALARSRGVVLDVQVPDDDRLAVTGSADDLARAVSNLVANAVRHTGTDQVVRLHGHRADDGHIRVEVSDGCGGIPEESLDRVFDAGWRGNGDRAGDGGAGLGLAIARGV